MNRTLLVLLTLAALVILGGIALGSAVEDMGHEIQAKRVEALTR